MRSGIRPSSALIGTVAYFWSIGIVIAVDWAVIRWGWRGRNNVFGGHQAITEGVNLTWAIGDPFCNRGDLSKEY